MAKAIGRKAGAALTVVATLLVGLIVMASPAGAHHPEGRLTDAACRDAYDDLQPSTDASQVLRVDYTATPWFSTTHAQSAFAHDNVTIQVSINGGAFTTISEYFVDEASISPANGAVAGDETVYLVDGAFVPVQPNLVFPLLSDEGDNRPHTQSGYFLVENDEVVTSIVGRIVANGPWRNGQGGGESRSMGTVEPYALDCEPEAPVEDPTASSTWECGTDITVTLDNSGSDVAVDFVVNDGAPVTVAAGETDTVTLDGPTEGATVPVSVSVDGEPLHTTSYGPADCEDPAASSTWECGSDITVTLDNSGSDVAVDFVVNDGAPVTVAAGETDTVTLDGPIEDGDPVTVTVTVDGETIHTDTYEADCLEPVVSSTWECGTDIVITLDNSASELAATFEIGTTPIDPDLGMAAVAVPAGAVETVDITGPVEDGDPISVLVKSGDVEVHSATYGPADCLDPSATSAWDCGTDIVVTLDNSESHLAVDFVVNGGDPVTVEAGDTQQVTIAAPVEDGAAVPVSVTVDGEEIHADSHGPANCVESEQEICEDDENAVDSNDDGENDACEPICEDDVDPSDTDGDNVGDTCPEVLDNTVVFPTSQPASAAAANSLAFTGSGSLALATGAFALLLLGFGLTLAAKELSEA